MGSWRRSYVQRKEKKTEEESRVALYRETAEAATVPAPETAGDKSPHISSAATLPPALERVEETAGEPKRCSATSSLSSAACPPSKEEEERRRLRESLLPESMQGELRQIVIKVEKRREYRGKGGDLIRIGVCKLIQALGQKKHFGVSLDIELLRKRRISLLRGVQRDELAS